MLSLTELKKNRTDCAAEMRSLVETADAERRDLTDVEAERFDALKQELATVERRIEQREALEKAVAVSSKPGTTPIIAARGDGRYEERAAQFSVTRAIRAAMGEPVDAGFEREISAEVARRSGRSFAGIAVPDEVFIERRTMLTTDAVGPLVPELHLADQFIDRLRASLITGRLGATILDGLVGDIDIPRQTQSATAQWVGEDEPLDSSDLDFDDVQLRPRTVGALTSYSRRALINAVPSIEGIVRRDLAAQIAGAIDKAAIIGTGSGNEPRGIASTSGIRLIPASGPDDIYTWGDILAFIAALDGTNALGGRLGWASNPYVVRAFRERSKILGVSGEGFIMDQPGNLAGYPLATTNNLPGGPSTPGTLVFGDWSSLLIGYWSGTDLLVNPYESDAYKRGRVLVRAMRDADIAVRQITCFAMSDDVK